jgi:pyruvate formate lyase activating enzyme
MALTIKGLNKTTLIDYPDKVACTIFLPRCNFRCGFCYNKELVIGYDSMPTMPEEEVLDFLKEKKKWLDGVVFTGAEPTLHRELIDFIPKLKEMGYLVKVDTNGTNPSFLKELIKLIDYVAMDIKGPLEKYDEITGVKVDVDKIKESIELIMNSGIDYEFRTTVVPGLHTKEEVKKVGELVKGCSKFFIQNFCTKGDILDDKFKEIKLFSKEELEEFKEILINYVPDVKIRSG